MMLSKASFFQDKINIWIHNILFKEDKKLIKLFKWFRKALASSSKFVKVMNKQALVANSPIMA